MIAQLLWAVSATCSLVAGIFFFRFYRETRDAFFALFAAAFGVLTAHWLFLAVVDQREHAPRHFVLRLVAFVLIALAIAVKNRG